MINLKTKTNHTIELLEGNKRKILLGLVSKKEVDDFGLEMIETYENDKSIEANICASIIGTIETFESGERKIFICHAVDYNKFQSSEYRVTGSWVDMLFDSLRRGNNL